MLPYSPEQLFALVGDVALYPEFVPWITHMVVSNERETAPGVTEVDAEAGVAFTVFSGHFSTRVRRDAKTREITVSLLSGPFRRLENRWRFEPHASGTLVHFHIDFEFASKLLDGLLAANMDHAVRRLIACFEGRARALYGSR